MPDSLMRFIILCGPRTGSNLLASALNSHPEIICFREVFNYTVPNIDYSVEGYDGRAPAALDLRKRDPGLFMERYIFGGHSSPVSAVGFKFIYEHFWDFPGLIESLQATDGLHVIHLKRRNGVRAFLSYKMAFATGTWQQRKARPLSTRLLATLTHPNRIPRAVAKRIRPSPPLRITLAPDECIEYIEHRREQEQHFAGLFHDKASIDILYEDLLRDRQQEFGRAEEFLGVSAQPLRETVERQNPGRMRELIDNFDELSGALRETPHGWMLDED